MMKVGMDSIMASYFALFEIINQSFGKMTLLYRCWSWAYTAAIASKKVTGYLSPSNDKVTFVFCFPSSSIASIFSIED